MLLGMQFEEKVTSTEQIYKGKILSLERQNVETPDGQTAQREIIHHVPAIALLMITDDHQMILEQQWRAPVHKVTLEIPAGKLDYRDNGDIRHAAQREMNEETRMKAHTLLKVASTLSSPGFTDEKITLFYATGLTKVEHQLPQDQDENIHLITVTLDEALLMIQEGQIDDMKTVMAIYYWAQKEKRV